MKRRINGCEFGHIIVQGVSNSGKRPLWDNRTGASTIKLLVVEGTVFGIQHVYPRRLLVGRLFTWHKLVTILKH